MRLDKYLADMGLGTRSELKKAIRGGVAQINGVVEKDPGASVSSEDHILWYGEPVAYESSVYYLISELFPSNPSICILGHVCCLFASFNTLCIDFLCFSR